MRTKSLTVFIVSLCIYHEVMGLDAMILVFWMLSFKPAFSLSSFTSIKKVSSSSLLSALRGVSSAYLRLLILRLLQIHKNNLKKLRLWYFQWCSSYALAYSYFTTKLLLLRMEMTEKISHPFSFCCKRFSVCKRQRLGSNVEVSSFTMAISLTFSVKVTGNHKLISRDRD